MSALPPAAAPTKPAADKPPQPSWSLPLLLALLGMLGPFATDTYIPAFSAIGKALNATPVQMQQTLSAYLLGFAFMNLFHGALSDSFGRRPVVLWGLALFTVTSAGCALAPNVGWLITWRLLQGFSTGAGIVVARAVVRDMFPPSQAQRVMSQITIFFGIAPAVAPLVGGVFAEHLPWPSVFWFMTAIGVFLWLAIRQRLPESLPAAARQPLELGHLLRGYGKLLSDLRFVLLVVASGIPFNGAFLYILSGPVFLSEVLHLAPSQFFWLFLFNIGGIMIGSWLSGRMAGRIWPRRQARMGFWIMMLMSLLNIVLTLLFTPHVTWALWPIGLFSLGCALMGPVVTLLTLDLHPERRGMASSLQAVVTSASGALVAGVIAPLVMHSALALALTAFVFPVAGLISWLVLRWHWPDIGQPEVE